MDEQFVNELAVALRKVGTIHTVGEEWHSYTGEIPVGGVPYCGQMVTRATYSALWKYAQEKYLVLDEANWQMYAEANGGNVPFYSSGDGSTTFRMPRIVGYVKGASSQSEAGTHLFEGLPNIEGYGIQVRTLGESPYNEVSGAIYYGTTNGDMYSSGGVDSHVGGFDASKSNSIYGASDHVTPETSTVLFGVYAFGAIIETGALDATTLSNGLAQLEIDLNTKVSSVNGKTPDASGDVPFTIGGTTIGHSAVDLNTFTEAGVYYIGSGSTDLNFPNGTNGILIVYSADFGTNKFIRQVFYRSGTVNVNDRQIYTRQILINENGTTVGNWIQDVYLVDSWHSGASWYRKYSDGFIEQGGQTSSAQTKVTLHTAMTTSSYVVTIAQRSSNDTWSTKITARTTTTFTVGSAYADGIFWYVGGY